MRIRDLGLDVLFDGFRWSIESVIGNSPISSSEAEFWTWISIFIDSSKFCRSFFINFPILFKSLIQGNDYIRQIGQPFIFMKTLWFAWKMWNFWLSRSTLASRLVDAFLFTDHTAKRFKIIWATEYFNLIRRLTLPPNSTKKYFVQWIQNFEWSHPESLKFKQLVFRTFTSSHFLFSKNFRIFEF